MEFYREFEFETKELERIGKEQGKIRESIQSLEHRKNETLMVKSELELLTDDEVVYKLIGPTLIQQDTGDSKVQIESRLEMITKQIVQLEKNYKENDIKAENCRKRLVEIQNKLLQLSKQKQAQK